MIKVRMSSRILPAQGIQRRRTSDIRVRPDREIDFASAMVNELTEEDRAYDVHICGEQAALSARRVGSNWYDGNGTFLTTSAEIRSIRIPARLA